MLGLNYRNGANANNVTHLCNLTLYKAFQELGKVIRTTFLLDYVSNKELRQTITATTNKVESYHTLEDWIRFGSRFLVASNDPDEMEKAVKHTDLIANCIMLQNVIDITDICHALIQEGYTCCGSQS